MVFRPALVPIEPIQLLHVSRDMKPTFQTYMVDTLQISYTYTFSCLCIAKCVIQQRDKLIVYISRYFIVGLLMVEILGCPASRNKCKVICLILGNSPESEFYIPTFRNTLFHLHRQVLIKMEQSVPKRRHVKFRRRGITQKNRTRRKFVIKNMPHLL